MEAATSSSLQVSSEACGTCVTLQFRRDTLVDGLSPAKLTVYPSLASPEAKEAYKQFFHVNSLNSSIAAEDTAAWRKTNAAFAHSYTNVFDTGIYIYFSSLDYTYSYTG